MQAVAIDSRLKEVFCRFLRAVRATFPRHAQEAVVGTWKWLSSISYCSAPKGILRRDTANGHICTAPRQPRIEVSGYACTSNATYVYSMVHPTFYLRFSTSLMPQHNARAHGCLTVSADGPESPSKRHDSAESACSSRVCTALLTAFKSAVEIDSLQLGLGTDSHSPRHDAETRSVVPCSRLNRQFAGRAGTEFVWLKKSTRLRCNHKSISWC